MVKSNKLAQTFSAEILVVMVILLFTSLFLVMIKINHVDNIEKVNNIQKESFSDSKIIIDHLKKNNILDSQNKIDVHKLVQLNEGDLREQFNIKNDFAITFEKDGKIVKIDPENNITCIGSNKIVINGQKCSN